MNPFVFLMGVFLVKLAKIIYPAFIFLSMYYFMSKYVEPMITRLTNSITQKISQATFINNVVSDAVSYFDVFHAVNILVSTLTVLTSIKMFSLALRAFGFGNNGG